MPEWYLAFDEGQRRLLLALGAVVAAMALVLGGVVLTGDDDPEEASVETDGAASSTTARPTTTSSASSSSTTSTSSPTSSTSSTARAGGTTTTTRRSVGGGPATTKPTTTTKPPTTTAPTQPPSSGPCATGGGAAGQMATLFCNHRANKGLPSMSRNGQLDAMAQEWAQKMANDQALSHRPNTEARQMVAARCDCPGWAEIVAYDDTAQGAFDGWLGSTSHRGHIEDGRDGEFGIGVASAGGYLWFVQVFGYYG